jgi:sugar phosphate isomerase/epimerase
MKIHRREFLQKSGTALASAALVSSLPVSVIAGAPVNPVTKSLSFGFQVWTIRKKLVADFPGTLKEMAGMGYTEVEMCSPLGYSDAGFAPLHALSGKEMRTIIEDAGIRCTSSHVNIGELRDSLDDRIEWAHQLGMKQLALAVFWIGKDASLDAYREAAQELNQIGEKTKKAGIQMLYHNHHHEFQKRGDTLVYDVLLEEFDPELVKMQFQVAVHNIGYKAVDYFRAYPGRFQSAHLADWSASSGSQVPIGQGDINWKEFFKVARKSGVQNYYVEMAPETFPDSAAFLKDA